MITICMYTSLFFSVMIDIIIIYTELQILAESICFSLEVHKHYNDTIIQMYVHVSEFIHV